MEESIYYILHEPEPILKQQMLDAGVKFHNNYDHPDIFNLDGFGMIDYYHFYDLSQHNIVIYAVSCEYKEIFLRLLNKNNIEFNKPTNLYELEIMILDLIEKIK